MAGFLETTGLTRFRDRLIEVSKFGMRYDDLFIKNSQAIGFIEGEMRKRAGASGMVGDDLLKYSMAISDTTSAMRGKTLAFFQLDYMAKREKLRDMASNSEIEFVLENIADDVIVFDGTNRFCKPRDLGIEFQTPKGLATKESSIKYADEIKEAYSDTFQKIYNAWGFNVGISAWQYFYQFLIEGKLAFEIIYDNIEKPKEIIGFKELDPSTLFAIVQKDHTGKIYMEWMQRDDAQGKHRRLTDAQIIYIDYSNFFRTKRTSFVERMLRSFNLLRIMEHSKVIWQVMNSPMRLKTTIPIGTKSIQKAKEDMQEFLATFKEDIFFDASSGELKVDGQPKILFYKNYIIPKNDRGEQVDIEAIEYKGPDLENSELINYFLRKLKLDSKLPFSRWDYNEGGGSYLLGTENVLREEIIYQKFISRLRTCIQEMILKPWHIQMCLQFDGLKNDYTFKNSMGISYIDENEFKKIKEQDINKKAAETIEAMTKLKRDDGSSMFSLDFLAKRYMGFNEDDLKENEDLLLKAKMKGGKPAEGGEAGAPPTEGGPGEAAPAPEAPPAEAPPAEEAPPA